ncbi:hypothetical protein C7S18_12250 [Ahniella affigens]|uniref:Transglycosylase SLT domain-containing protein n=1 Tax=Ahniella affigens TaxID=2021234 RepID=A0A2P1PSV7_9GAMM|nr:transglycosylase SLT domain-containing protein [Ahniella affigens]AVP97923.1 hypothetical protein C7S18_12250 [Ahniella affigens]
MANWSRNNRITAGILGLIALGWILIVVVLAIGLPAPEAHAASKTPRANKVQIPEHSVQYRLAIERETVAVFGLDASPARIAAQIHQESAWRATAESPYAQGLAQFTPATAKWIATVFPEDCGSADPWDTGWAIRCAVRYDKWLMDRIDAEPGCDEWAMVLSAYNGGLGWLNRDIKAARLAGNDPRRWFGHVELTSGRAAWAMKENRSYPRRILTILEHAYIAAGWDGVPVCAKADAP